MIEGFRKLIAKELHKLADRFDTGTTEADETQMMDIINMLTHQPMSKEMACNYLNMSRSRFDDKIREGLIPKGRKRVGFKELIWFRDELEEIVKNGKKKQA